MAAAYAAAGAVDTPHGVQQENKNPQRGMNSNRRSASWSQDYFDALLVGTETGVLIDKTSKTMTAVQDRGQFRVARRRIAAKGVRTLGSRLVKATRPRQGLSPSPRQQYVQVAQVAVCRAKERGHLQSVLCHWGAE